jgi:hypothetical protein
VKWIVVAVAVVLAVGCGDDDGRAGLDAATRADAPGASDGGRDGGSDPGDGGESADGTVVTDGGAVGCPRAPAAAERARWVVVSHPFAAGGGDGNRYSVLALPESGELSMTGTSFTMGTGSGGTIAFTPVGEIGVLAQKDGSVGIFRLEDDGSVTVIEAAYDGSFYAASVVADPAGTHVWVLDAQWRESGGGIYRLDLDCDGAVIGDSLVAPSKLPYAMVMRDATHALVGAHDVLSSGTGDDAHLLRLDGAPAALAGADAFGDDEAIVASGALTANGRHFLLGDNSAFSGIPNRVAVVSVDGDTLAPVQVITPIEDPVAIVTSPFDDAAIVASGFGDAIFVLDYDEGAATPFTLRGELPYTGTPPQLPGAAVLVHRGTLEGLALLAENVAVRRIRFEGGGTVTDLGPTVVGAGVENVVGAIGLTP